MTRFFILILSLFAWTGEPDGTPSTVQEIRQAYAAAHQMIEDSHHPGVPRNELVENIEYMIPALGTTYETFCCYYQQALDETDWTTRYHPYFITRKYNMSVKNIYEEYLYDTETGRLLFVFIQTDMGDDSPLNEERYYYGPDGLISTVIKGERTIADGKLSIFAKILRDSVKIRLDANARR